MKKIVIFLCLFVSISMLVHATTPPHPMTCAQDSESQGGSATDGPDSDSDKLGSGSGDDSDTVNDAEPGSQDPEIDQGASQ